MADHSHLDELITASSSKLDTELLEAFRSMIRNPDISTTDYASRLKIIMEESIQQERQHAATATDNS